MTVDRLARQQIQALTILAEHPQISQRALSQELSISLGRTNRLLSQLESDGLIRRRATRSHRIAYALTAKGTATRTSLLLDWVHHADGLYTKAHQVLANQLKQSLPSSPERLVCLGSGPLLKVVLLAAADLGHEVVAIVDPELPDATLYGIPVLQDISGPQAHAATWAVALADGMEPGGKPVVRLEAAA